MAKKDINGQFYLNLTRNGNLLGEFSNNSGDSVSTESADVDADSEVYVDENGKTIEYVRKWKSTWQEDGKPIFANLIITPRKDTGNKIFTLVWKNSKGDRMFVGEGMLDNNNTLIGRYKSA